MSTFHKKQLRKWILKNDDENRVQSVLIIASSHDFVTLVLDHLNMVWKKYAYDQDELRYVNNDGEYEYAYNDAKTIYIYLMGEAIPYTITDYTYMYNIIQVTNMPLDPNLVETIITEIKINREELQGMNYNTLLYLPQKPILTNEERSAKRTRYIIKKFLSDVFKGMDLISSPPPSITTTHEYSDIPS